jgi:plastocyanin
MRTLRVAVATAALVLVAFGPLRTVVAEDTTIVVAKAFMFSPVTLTVSAGSTVTWTNHGEEPHTVASDSGLFRSGALDSNESFSYRFDKPGIYRYVCSIHPQMTGTVIVK